jgi:hypothetical protein
MVSGMRFSRLATLCVFLSFAAACAGSGVSVLRTLGKPSGDGAAELTIKNASGASINQLYVAKTESVDKAREAAAHPGTEADQTLWGDDQLGNAGIADGSSWAQLRLPPDRYDVLVVAADRREQLVKHVNLQAGGHYVLEIREAWRQGRD